MAKIVVVDDEKINLKLVELALADNYEVVSFSDPESFIDFLHEDTSSDLFILDIMMPGTGGDELRAQLKDIHTLRHVPVIVQTALDLRDDRIKDIEGKFYYLKKPYSSAELRAMVEKALSSVDKSDQKQGFTPGELSQRTSSWE